MYGYLSRSGVGLVWDRMVGVGGLEAGMLSTMLTISMLNTSTITFAKYNGGSAAGSSGMALAGISCSPAQRLCRSCGGVFTGR